MEEPAVVFEAVNPKPVFYRLGNVCVELTCFNAWIYQAMVGVYGEDEATIKFWYLWHKKGSL